MAGTATLRASVCVCTRDRPEDLRRALASIAASDPPPHQVVVADDSEGSETASVLAESAEPITYVRGPRNGLGANRNAAIAAADGDFVLFLDDDALLGGEFLAAMERRLEAVPAERRRRTILAGTEINRGHTVVPNEQDLLGFQSRPYRDGESLRTVVINAALFPRELFDRVRFDPCITYGFDEVDLTTQAVAAGFEIFPCFEASNLHNPSSSGREDYGDAAVAARLYVTFKRRRWTEGSPSRAWLGLAAACTHVYVASVKRLGPHKGWARATRAISRACQDCARHKRERTPSKRGEMT